MAVSQHKTEIVVAVIGAAAVVLAAIITGILGFGPDWWRNLWDDNSTPPRHLTVKVPNDGKLPHSNIQVQIPDAKPGPTDAVWASVRNDKDTTWYLYPCTANAAGQGTCDNVVVGATVDSSGPWRISGIVVNESGRAKILAAKSHYKGDLAKWLGNDLIALGAASAYR